MAQMLLDKRVPLGPFPWLVAQHEVWNLFFDHCFPPTFFSSGGKKGPKEEEMGSQIKEGGTRSIQLCFRSMKKTYCLTLSKWQDASGTGHMPSDTVIQNFLRTWMVHWCCSRGSGLLSRKCRLKMRVSTWLVWLSWFYTWAVYSQRCKCQDIFPTETGLSKGSRSRIKEHVRHGLRHQHTSHRSRPQHRKGDATTLQRPTTLTCSNLLHIH